MMVKVISLLMLNIRSDDTMNTAERYVQRKLSPDARFMSQEYYDFLDDGLLHEVKSCKYKKPHWGHSTNGYGRFCINLDNHLDLYKNGIDNRYHFCVIRQNRVIDYMIIPVNRLHTYLVDIQAFTGKGVYNHISWVKLWKYFGREVPNTKQKMIGEIEMNGNENTDTNVKWEKVGNMVKSKSKLSLVIYIDEKRVGVVNIKFLQQLLKDEQTSVQISQPIAE